MRKSNSGNSKSQWEKVTMEKGRVTMGNSMSYNVKQYESQWERALY